ncbi:MAG: hypothetical protein SFV52_01065 [Saprospiraceae bacterium]|nr:hypothetical protein [Saprospiraceae bacterium]
MKYLLLILLFFQLLFPAALYCQYNEEADKKLQEEYDRKRREDYYGRVLGIPMKTPKPPFYTRSWNSIFGGDDFKTERKMMLRFLNNPNDPDLANFVREVERGINEGDNQEVNDAIREFPFMFHFLLAVYYDCHKRDWDKAYIYYLASNKVGKNELTPKDRGLMTKFVKEAKNERCFEGANRLEQPSDLILFAESKAFNRKRKTETDVEDRDTSNNTAKTRLLTLTQRSAQLARAIDSLHKLQDNKRITIENLSLDNYREALTELNRLKSEKSLNLSQGTLEQSLAGGAVLKAADGIPTDPVKPELYTSGFQLGTFCSEEIRSSTRSVFTAILDLVSFKEKYANIPPDFIDSVEILVNITGKADGNRIVRDKNGNCTLQYKGTTGISGRYFAFPDTIQQIKVDIRTNDAICDKELGFLRANCALSEIMAVVEGYKFPQRNIKSRLVSRVFSEKGDDYRGVDVTVEIRNLFLHNLQTIKALQKEKLVVDKQIAELERLIAENEREIEKLQTSQTNLDQTADDIYKNADQYQPGGRFTPRKPFGK